MIKNKGKNCLNWISDNMHNKFYSTKNVLIYNNFSHQEIVEKIIKSTDFSNKKLMRTCIFLPTKLDTEFNSVFISRTYSTEVCRMYYFSEFRNQKIKNVEYFQKKNLNF